VALPPPLQERLAETAAPLRSIAAGVSWVSAANYHLTVKFLGDVDGERVGEIAAALGAAVAGRESFDLALRGLGAFPNPVRPRVIWAGVSAGAADLAALAGAVEERLSAIGFPPGTRDFSAHVTLGRVREPRRNTALVEALARVGDVELGSMRVDRVVLMQSRLSPNGARYTELAALPLVGRP
jgi:2'-5' RNA ligase